MKQETKSMTVAQLFAQMKSGAITTVDCVGRHLKTASDTERWVLQEKNDVIDCIGESRNDYNYVILLLDSLASGVPMPPITLVSREDGTFDVVDGYRRLYAMYNALGGAKTHYMPMSIHHKNRYDLLKEKYGLTIEVDCTMEKGWQFPKDTLDAIMRYVFTVVIVQGTKQECITLRERTRVHETAILEVVISRRYEINRLSELLQLHKISF